MTGLALGVTAGLLSATLQSFSYLGGQRFLATAGNARQLLTASLLIAGAGAWFMSLFFWAGASVLNWKMWGYITLASGGFCFGQYFFFIAQNKIESSRIASLLGLKVFVVMFFSILIIGTEFHWLQYVAAAGTALAAMLMNWEKKHPNWNGMDALALTLVGYSLSDIGIQLVVSEIPAPDSITCGMQGFVLTQGSLGIVALIGIPLFHVRPAMIRAALPQGLCWMFAMWGLYVCFGILGAAFGNVIQATRGVISLILGMAAAALGMVGGEPRRPWQVWAKRGIAALLMFAAILLFAIGSR